MIFETKSSGETQAVGRAISKMLRPNDKIFFFGDLGSGKTTLIQGIVAEWTGLDILEINSPTFNTLNIFEENGPLYHFDLYRIEDEKEFHRRGLAEHFESQGLCLIEWAERIPALNHHANMRITLNHAEEHKRTIEMIR